MYTLRFGIYIAWVGFRVFYSVRYFPVWKLASFPTVWTLLFFTLSLQITFDLLHISVRLHRLDNSLQRSNNPCVISKIIINSRLVLLRKEKLISKAQTYLSFKRYVFDVSCEYIWKREKKIPYRTHVIIVLARPSSNEFFFSSLPVGSLINNWTAVTTCVLQKKKERSWDSILFLWKKRVGWKG